MQENKHMTRRAQLGRKGKILKEGRALAALKSEAGDIKMLGGTLNGQSLDPMGLSFESIPAWTHQFNKEFKKFKNAIDSHFSKISNPVDRPTLDKVAIDYVYMDEISLAIGQSPTYLRQD